MTIEPTAVPLLIAHRGYAARYPENTLPAIDAAIAAGARFVEVDVHLSADGVPMLMHDADVERTTGRAARIDELTRAEIAILDAGEARRFGSTFRRTAVPSLEEAARLVERHPGVTLFVEIKRASLDRFGPGRVVDAVLAAAGAVADRSVLISFDAGAVACGRRSGARSIGWVLAAWDDRVEAIARDLRPDWLFCDRLLVPPGARPFWPGDWRWAVYEVETAAEALDLAARGAHAIETMRVGDLVSDPCLHVEPVRDRPV